MGKSIFKYENEIIIITGGATGIGLALAMAFLEAHAKVAIIDRDEKLLLEIQSNFNCCKGNVLFELCDITDQNSLEIAVNHILAVWGRIDVLINNAGIISRTSSDMMTDADFYKEWEVDVVAPLHLAKLVFPSMKDNGGGKIINMCSIMSDFVRENTAGYSACKGALKMLTRGLACDWGKYNIQCNGVAPGYIETAQTQPIRENDEAFYRYIEKRTIAKRWGNPDDIIGAVLFLASADASYITGQILTVDGGMNIYIGEK